jgi:predicted  nucleic acid-binding Zn-ribbon protein
VAILGIKTNLTRENSKTLMALMNEAQAEIAAIQGNLSRAQEEISELQMQLATSQSDVDAFENQTEALSESVSALEARTTGFAQSLEDTVANITEISNDFADLQIICVNLQNDLSSLEANMQTVQTQIANILYDISYIKTQMSDLQSKTSELEDRLDSLNSTGKIVVRLSFLSFEILGPTTPPPLPEDYLFDVGIYIAEGDQRLYPSISSTRSGHSRFIRPTYVELAFRNGSEVKWDNGTIANVFLHPGETIFIYVVAYWHIEDGTIGIQPDPSWGPQSWSMPWSESGSQLFIPYTIGTVKLDSVDGRDDGYPERCDAFFQYKIVTFYEDQRRLFSQRNRKGVVTFLVD